MSNIALPLAGVLLLTAMPGVSGAEPPRTICLPASGLEATRAALARGEGSLTPVLNQLRVEAEALLALKPASVMDKKKIAASGDRHDYFSLAPYWWPDPAKPDGLPYIRRDGDVHPESRKDTDRTPFVDLCQAVSTLGLAHGFTGDERYARQAARLTRVWFLDAATRMNPNLNHAQAIPGINDGRGAGVIETRHLTVLIDGLALIAGSSAWPPEAQAAMNAWLADYYRWLTTSPIGRQEAEAKNNHGTWYDVQTACLALALGRKDDARRIVAAARQKRIAKQITPEGLQPLEMVRTRSLNYTLLNVEGLVLLAQLGDAVGVDLWSYATDDGRSLRTALRQVAPFLDPGKPWIKKDLDLADRGRIPPLLAAALRHGDDPQLRAPLARFAGTPRPGERWRLWSAGLP